MAAPIAIATPTGGTAMPRLMTPAVVAAAAPPASAAPVPAPMTRTELGR